MENAEEIFHFLEEFSKRKPKTIPPELNEYLAHVARTGDPVYQWSLVKSLFKEKLLNVITDFYETTPGIDIPPYPNVDPFNYDTMKNSLLERLDSFTSAPFTVQRICELLTYPRKQYNRVDKFMRAIEKNILVVSTREPGTQRQPEPENGEQIEPIVNGSDNNSEYNVDVEMEDMSWKENNEQKHNVEPQPSSSETHISVDEIEARLKAKQETPMDTENKTPTQYESVTPPELNVSTDEPPSDTQPVELPPIPTEDSDKSDIVSTDTQVKQDVEMKNEIDNTTPALVIPEIKIDDAEMTEQKLTEQHKEIKEETPVEKEVQSSDEKPPPVVDDNSSDSITKEEPEPKLISEVSTSSEESSSSSDNTDGNSNSPKPVEVHEDSSQSDSNPEPLSKEIKPSEITVNEETAPEVKIESDNYSISDVNSVIPQPTETPVKDSDSPSEETEQVASTEEKKEEQKVEATES